MVFHTCNVCNFSSKYTTNYRSHCLSEKHLRNLDKMENEKNMVTVSKTYPELSKTYPELSKTYPELSKTYPELSKTYPELSKNYPELSKNYPELSKNYPELSKNLETFQNKKFICKYCDKIFKYCSGLSKHKKKCKEGLKMEEENKILKIEIEKLKNQTSNNNTTNNININTTNYIKNDRVLNYLNSNHSDVIEMDNFINKLKNDTFLSREMMECFVTCYNNGGVDSFGSTLVKYLNQICKQLDINIFPLCCSDSNLRSHKEKNDIGWETVIETTKIEEIIQNIVTDIFMETGCMIPLDARERKKICNIVKKSYGLSSLKMLDELEDNSEIYIPLDA